LGSALVYGRGIDRDVPAGVRYLRVACKQGDPTSMDWLGWALEKGGPELKPDLDEAVAWYRKASDAGHAQAAVNLGRLHATGALGPAARADAMRWYRKAADLGNPWAMNHVGWQLVYGRGITHDPKEAAEWFQKAADKGNLDAQVHLSNLYREGRGVE